MKKIVLLAAAFLPSVTLAQSFLIENVRIFNGVDPELTAGHVLVEDGVIAAVSEDAITPPDGATVIDGGNRVLSPGFIDLHVHLNSHVPAKLGDAHPTTVGAISNDVARHFLESGFTTIRDAGGTHPDLARAIEAGVIYGPRVFPSGAVLSQTGGHGDWRQPSAPHPTLESGSPYMDSDTGVLVDGVDQHLAAARENLRRGATQIKIMGGGGVMSDYDPIDSLQPSPAEIRAAVERPPRGTPAAPRVPRCNGRRHGNPGSVERVGRRVVPRTECDVRLRGSRGGAACLLRAS